MAIKTYFEAIVGHLNYEIGIYIYIYISEDYIARMYIYRERKREKTTLKNRTRFKIEE